MTAGQARELLGLPPGADAAALARAYRIAVKAAHPDLAGGDDERLRKVIEAHKVLKSLGEARMNFTPSPPAREAKPATESFSLKVTLREALSGGRRRVTVASGRALTVRLPKGLRSGDVLKLRGMGRARADIAIRVDVEAGPGLEIRGDDLWLEVTASADQLKPGARLEVDTPRGRRALKAPQGAAEGRLIRLKGQGLPARGRRPSGDLILKLTVVPGEPASKKLLRRFMARWAA